MRTLSVLLLASFFSSLAFADQPLASNCKQPTIPNPQSSDMVVKFFNKHHEEYSKCIDKFVKEQQAIYKGSTDPVVSSAAHDAAEAAIKEFNNYTALLKTRNDATGTDDEVSN